MKKILYTQRVLQKNDYGERWDCADQNIAKLISSCGYLPIAVNNHPDDILKNCSEIKPDGLVLTGGNSLVKYGGDAPERDETEKRLIDYFLSRSKPIYGFCRGMQVLQDYFGVNLYEVKGHISVKHFITGSLGDLEVNSYHSLGAFDTSQEMNLLAKSPDNVVEAISFKHHPILGTMWHPEREMPFCKHDIKRIKTLFDEGKVQI